jgi:hypothetical protein
VDEIWSSCRPTFFSGMQLHFAAGTVLYCKPGMNSVTYALHTVLYRLYSTVRNGMCASTLLETANIKSIVENWMKGLTEDPSYREPLLA